ncbi:hypothetical protein M0812_02881 [Anaeramoeba flamelloides]|uniref:PAS domain-containing protein n=1 Tax=Anaeramoeba flamelloides TaxID=1746091 RepID=A0AAV7YRX0_9EUKA|nr:hypothetical protein M0812_02881 [Anaeramoeba flamelloides]
MGNKQNSFVIARRHQRSYEKRINQNYDLVLAFTLKKKGILCAKANKTACKIFGYKKKEIHNMSIIELSNSRQPISNKPLLKIIEEKKAELEKNSEGTDCLYWSFKKSFGIFYATVNLRLILISGKKGFQIILTEISNRPKEQKQEKTLQYTQDNILMDGALVSDYTPYYPTKRKETNKNNKSKKTPSEPKKNTTINRGRTLKKTSISNSRSYSCTPKIIKQKNEEKKKKQKDNDNLLLVLSKIQEIKLEISSFDNKELEDKVNQKLRKYIQLIRVILQDKEKDAQILQNSISRERKENVKNIQTLENTLQRRLKGIEKEKEKRIQLEEENNKSKKQISDFKKLFNMQLGLNTEIGNCLEITKTTNNEKKNQN